MLREANKNEYSYLSSLGDYQVTENSFNKVIVYEIDNKIVAYIDYSVIYERIEINYIFVLLEQRRKNIGLKLLEYIINNYNFENITLEVNVNNNPAINLYKKLGFQVIAIRRGYYDGVDGYLMERR